MKEIMIECNNYFGEPSEQRCRLVEKLVEEEIKDDCKLKDIVMKEVQVQDSLIQPIITIRYDAGETQLLTELIDRSLIEIGVTAIKMVVSKIASRAVEGALAGGVGRRRHRSCNGKKGQCRSNYADRRSSGRADWERNREKSSRIRCDKEFRKVAF